MRRGSTIVGRLLNLLSSVPAFDRLPEEVRRDLLRDLTVRYYEPGTTILEQDRTAHERLYIVESGFVRLTDTKTGRLVEKYGEGEMFGNYGLMKGGPLPYEARSVEPTVCVLLPAESFRRLYADHELFAAFFDEDLRGHSLGDEKTLDIADAPGARLLFATRIGDLVAREPLFCTWRSTAREAARSMRRERANSVIVRGEDGGVAGILTDADLRDKLVADAASADTLVERIMNPCVLMLDGGEPVFKALVEMMQNRANHVVVIGGACEAAASRVVGVISDQDISRAQSHSPAFMTDRIERASSVAELSGLRAETDGLLAGLARQGITPSDLIAVNTELNDRLMRRVISLCAEETSEDAPDLAWAWLSLGSEGRGEMGLVNDQDNALVYADPPDGDEETERWFESFAERANAALADTGFALCEGEIMARNPLWRRSLSGWEETLRGWTLSPDPREMMQAATFSDVRGLLGEKRLAEELKGEFLKILDEDSRFLPLLAQEALSNRPPLSFFRRFVVERSGEYRHTFNIKRRGLRPLADAARVLAIQTGYLESANTADRLEHAAKEIPSLAATMQDALEANHYLAELRMSHHLTAIRSSEKPTNQINPSDLTSTQQSMLKVVFSTVQRVQEAVARRFGLSLRL